ncbi:MAG: hypothetical protein V1753_08150, partial [Pseudomonadota bacterium]
DSCTEENTAGKDYSFVAYYTEIGYGLIEVQHWEGSTNYLVDMKTGKETDIIGYPTLSPDKKRIAVENADLESGYTDNVLSVYEIRPDGLVAEFIEKPKEWAPVNLRWINNQEITFVQRRINPNWENRTEKTFFVETPKKLIHRNAKSRDTAKWSIKGNEERNEEGRP